MNVEELKKKIIRESQMCYVVVSDFNSTRRYVPLADVLEICNKYADGDI